VRTFNPTTHIQLTSLDNVDVQAIRNYRLKTEQYSDTIETQSIGLELSAADLRRFAFHISRKKMEEKISQ
jgi:hypothetical protein